jgi:NADPH-dependent 2,4-dienoyl-CoA reductase/sulfur reductase-like enzyme
MPYYVSGLIHKSDQMIALSPDEAVHKRGIELFTNHEATRIDRAAKTVTVRDLATGSTFEQDYGKLVFAAGARAIRPDLNGIGLPGVFTLKEFQSGLDLKAYIEHEKPTRGVVVGGGYVGVEVAEAFGRLGMEVTVVEALPRLMTIMDEDMSAIIAHEMENNYVKILTGMKVAGFGGKDRVRSVVLEDGSSVEADCVVVSVGVAPNSELAAQAGLDLGERGAVLVDRFQLTSDPDIYAAGDCCTAYHRVLKRDVYIPLGLTANRQGRICGENISAELKGKPRNAFPGILGTAVTKVFDLEIGKTGIGETEILRYNLSGYGSAVIKAKNLPEYYPGSADLWVKIYFDKGSKAVAGGQVVGTGGAALRIDTLAAAVTAGMTLDDLYGIDAAYAPPFAPVWDPLLVAARIAGK